MRRLNRSVANSGPQYGLPLARGRVQELLEAVLREQHDLQELRPGERQHLGERLRDVDGLRSDAVPLAVDPLRELRRGVVLRRAGAPPLGPLVVGLAAHEVPDVAELELQLDVARILRCRVVAADAVRALPLVAWHAAIECEDDGIEHARLPGTRLPADEEDAVTGELVEVDLLLAPERAEPCDPQCADPHASAPISASCRSTSSRSSSLSPSPRRTNVRNPSTSSASLLPVPTLAA